MIEKGVTIWLTGYSGAGKTTIAKMMAEELLHQKQRVEILDGDLMRDTLSKDLGFSPEDRRLHNERLGYIAELLTKHGVYVIVSAISPFREVRDKVREMMPHFFEVYVNCPLEECEKRDVKGLYKMVRDGKIRNFTGIDSPYEAPLNPEVVCYTQKETVMHSVNKIIKALQSANYLIAEADIRL